MKTFFQPISEDNKLLKILSFDCQKCVALLKLPHKAWYFFQPIYFWNLTIFDGNFKSLLNLTTSKSPVNSTTVFAFVCRELYTAKDSNLIASAVYGRPCNMLVKDTTKIIWLFCDDGYAIILATEKSTTEVKLIEIIYPMVIHSFLPPDWVFGIDRKNR